MILPLSFLKKVEYYTDTSCYFINDYRNSYRTVITLHFKNWFRPRKKMYFEWDYVYNSELKTFRSPPELIQLRSQLVDYFGNMEEQLNGPVIK